MSNKLLKLTVAHWIYIYDLWLNNTWGDAGCDKT